MYQEIVLTNTNESHDEIMKITHSERARTCLFRILLLSRLFYKTLVITTHKFFETGRLLPCTRQATIGLYCETDEFRRDLHVQVLF
jgi:hypothetical protein